MKDLINNKADEELLHSILAEIAKSKNELSCSMADIQKVQSRISFLLVLVNTLIKRGEDK